MSDNINNINKLTAEIKKLRKQLNITERNNNNTKAGEFIIKKYIDRIDILEAQLRKEIEKERKEKRMVVFDTPDRKKSHEKPPSMDFSSVLSTIASIEETGAASIAAQQTIAGDTDTSVTYVRTLQPISEAEENKSNITADTIIETNTGFTGTIPKVTSAILKASTVSDSPDVNKFLGYKATPDKPPRRVTFEDQFNDGIPNNNKNNWDLNQTAVRFASADEPSQRVRSNFEQNKFQSNIIEGRNIHESFQFKPACYADMSCNFRNTISDSRYIQQDTSRPTSSASMNFDQENFMNVADQRDFNSSDNGGFNNFSRNFRNSRSGNFNEPNNNPPPNNFQRVSRSNEMQNAQTQNENVFQGRHLNAQTARNSFLRRLRLIPKFDGASFKELRDFIETTESLYLSCINEVEETEFFEQMVLQLRGEARRAMLEVNEASYEAIKNKLMSHFSYLSNKDILNSQLENLRQEKDESIAKYAERARKLLQEKNSMYSILTPEQKIEHGRMARKSFANGIRDAKLRDRLKTRGANSLEEAIAYSIEMEGDSLHEIPKREQYCGFCNVNGHREVDCRRKNSDNSDVNKLISALQALGTNRNRNSNNFGNRMNNNNGMRQSWGNNNINYNRNRLSNNNWNNNYNSNQRNGNNSNFNPNRGNWNNRGYNNFNNDRGNWNSRNNFNAPNNNFDRNNRGNWSQNFDRNNGSTRNGDSGNPNRNTYNQRPTNTGINNNNRTNQRFNQPSGLINSLQHGQNQGNC